MVAIDTSEHLPSMRAELLRGRLDITVSKHSIEPNSLFGFAERRNPKRAFLFVSKVLGRHIPAKPSVMQNTYVKLAQQIPADIPGPVLVVGMAETAVGLGAGVHRAYSALRDDTAYLVSTRHSIGSEIFTRFEEEHSHASAHLVHMPHDAEIKRRMLEAKSIVLVDDEASTGNTFINLLAALKQAGLDQIERVVTVTLTDWSAGAVQASLPENVTAISLLEGQYRFTENPSAPLPEMPDVSTTAAGEWPIDPAKDWGRMGVIDHQDTLTLENEPQPGEKVLVIGTNEFVWRPFLLAERLEQAGVDVYFSSTTRSPIALGHEIKHALAFGDNYGLGIANFLYNVAPGQFDRVIICTETDPASVDPQLIAALNAEMVADV